MYGLMDGWMEGWMDGWMDGLIVEWDDVCNVAEGFGHEGRYSLQYGRLS